MTFTWYNPVSWLKDDPTTENDVYDLCVRVIHGGEYALHEIHAAFAWLYDHTDEISKSIESVATVASFLTSTGVPLPPSVLDAVSKANIAVAALNVMVANKDKGDAAALVAGYVAAQEAWVASENATIATIQK